MEQHHNQQTLGGISVHGTGGGANAGGLPHLVPVNGGPVHHSGFGGGSKFSSTTLPKVHLPHHHHHQTTTSSLLPGILKTNMLQPKSLHKPTKIKVSVKRYSRLAVSPCSGLGSCIPSSVLTLCHRCGVAVGGASASQLVDPRSVPLSSQTKDVKCGIYSFPA